MGYIHKEGWGSIILVIAVLFVLNIVVLLVFPGFALYQAAIVAFSLILIMFVVSFFRNPAREITPQDNTILSPADGKVVAIEEVYEDEFFNQKRTLVSIFMSPANIHVNRTPINGAIKYVKYHPGKYLVAWHPKSSTENERTSVVIENQYLNVMMRQIAGAVARRIVYYVKEGEQVKQGEEMGFIKFGSRVDVYLPLGTEVDVEINQKVQGGITIIAHI